MKVIFVCYPTDESSAPHPAMAVATLARMGHEVIYLAWGNLPPAKWLDDCIGRIQHRLCPKRGILSALGFLFEVVPTILSAKPDCVLVEGAQQTPFALWLLGLPRKFQLIYQTQNVVGPGQSWIYESCEGLFARHCDWVIVNEPNRARFFQCIYRLKKTPEVIRTALPALWPVPERTASYRDEVVLALGLANVKQLKLIAAGGGYRDDRMSPQLVEALLHLPKNYIVVFSDWPGSDGRRRCEEQVRKLKLEGRVVFREAPGFAGMMKMLTACDIGIMLYPDTAIGHFYQSPGRLTEYLRCGVPIVTSKFPGLELLFLKYGLGETAIPDSSESIAEAIRKIGEIPVPEIEHWRKRLQETALGELAYETQALPVFEKVFGAAFRETSAV